MDNKKVSEMIKELDNNNHIIKKLYNWPRLTEFKCQSITDLIKTNMLLFESLLKLKSELVENDIKFVQESIELNHAMIKNVARRNQVQDSKRLESLINWELDIQKVTY